MPLIYITGTPGVGKSTVLRELQARSYNAHGTDEHGYCQWVHRETGKIEVLSDEADLHAWYKDHEWTLNPMAIAKLRHDATVPGKTIFLCGVAAGTEEVWDYFDTVIVLSADTETLRQRIVNRTDNNFGKAPNELKIILEWQDKHIDDYKEKGAIVIDAARPIKTVVDKVVDMTQS